MAKAHQLPSGAWRCQVYAGKDPNGKRQYRSFTALSKKEAEYMAAEFSMRYKEISRDSSAMTLREATEKYIENKSNILSPSTLRGYTIMARRHLQGLMPIRLNRLNNTLIQQAINAEAKTASPKYVRNLHGLLSAVLREYYPSFQLTTSLPQKQIREQRFLEPEQITVLLQAVRGNELEIPVLMGLWLGMRSSEITGLTWTDVDFQRGTIFIHRSKVRNADNAWIMKETTKNLSSTRSLHVPDYLLDLLRFSKGDAGPDDPVVPIEGNCLWRRLQVILKRAGLPPIRFHDLRHTFASSCAVIGIPLEYAKQRGGWSTTTTMQKVYTHVMNSKQMEVDQQIDSFFQSLMQG